MTCPAAGSAAARAPSLDNHERSICPTSIAAAGRPGCPHRKLRFPSARDVRRACGPTRFDAMARSIRRAQLARGLGRSRSTSADQRVDGSLDRKSPESGAC